ncbi:hypothetical protein CYMTET_55987 [Cymbomonas tetramitiformis]|uniref:Uncharacterized protein n=1 Tax=Cymbomonas tetramitiformis TaxID=36881 RepID=A0AAE0BD25_9CHLO|nr:hypothetical protein CYMTET_55987 [Cymbomonas tetramitiformis]
MDFRWLNTFCLKSKCKMETLKKLRKLASHGDRCFSFYLKDGYHAVRIDPDFQEFMQFDIHGAGARVPPYMDDFLVITKTQADAFVQRGRLSKLLSRLGFFRNEKKGHWEPIQLGEHLGLEVDFEEVLFRVTEKRLKKIHSKATALLCRAAREQRWVQARELAGFNGLCQSVYLAVPAASVYLRELYFVPGKKKNWGSKVKLTRQAWGDLQCNGGGTVLAGTIMLFRACVYVVVSFVTVGRPQTETAVVLEKEKVCASRGGHYTTHSTKKGAATCARAVGVSREKVGFFGEWSQLSSAVQAYIDPTAVADSGMVYYFGWLTPGWQQTTAPEEK